MPQLDLFSYFSAATYLILSFLVLIFILHTYYLPKIATVLKFRKRIEKKHSAQKTGTEEITDNAEEAFLSVTNRFVNEMDKINKTINK